MLARHAVNKLIERLLAETNDLERKPGGEAPPPSGLEVVLAPEVPSRPTADSC